MNSVFIECSSPLLQHNLEREFNQRVTDRDSAEVIITDYLQCEKCIQVGKDIYPPLLFNNIMAQLSPEEEPTPEIVEENFSVEKKSGSDSKLRVLLSSITDRYIDEVIRVTEEFYEKKR